MSNGMVGLASRTGAALGSFILEAAVPRGVTFSSILVDGL
jgi:hypothetical protein